MLGRRQGEQGKDRILTDFYFSQNDQLKYAMSGPDILCNFMSILSAMLGLLREMLLPLT